MKTAFKFEIAQKVDLLHRANDGEIIERRRPDGAEDEYLVRYPAASGEMLEEWYTDFSIAPA